jgi:hypothetical protein
MYPRTAKGRSGAGFKTFVGDWLLPDFRLRGNDLNGLAAKTRTHYALLSESRQKPPVLHLFAFLKQIRNSLNKRKKA